MSVSGLQNSNLQNAVSGIVSENIKDVKEDIQTGISNIQTKALSFFRKTKETVLKNLSFLKSLFITGSMVVAIVAAVKGLAAVGLAALGPAGWAVIGGAFLIGLAICAYDAHAKGKSIKDTIKSVLSDICTYTALCILSVANKVIAEKQSIGQALVSLKDDILGKGKQMINAMKNEMEGHFEDLKRNIQDEIGSLKNKLSKKKDQLSYKFDEILKLLEDKIEQRKDIKKEDKNTLTKNLKEQIKKLKNEQISQFEEFIKNFDTTDKEKGIGKLQTFFDNFMEQIKSGKDKEGNAVTIDKLVSDFQNTTSEISGIMGDIISKTKNFLQQETGLLKHLDIGEVLGIAKNGALDKIQKYGMDKLGEKCLEIETLSDGNQTIKDALSNVVQIIRQPKQTNAKGTFESFQKSLSNLKNAAANLKSQKVSIAVERFVKSCERQFPQDSFEIKSDEDQVQDFFNTLFGIKDPPKDVQNP